MPADATTRSTASQRGDDSESPRAPLLPPGEWVGGRYRVESLIGRGGLLVTARWV